MRIRARWFNRLAYPHRAPHVGALARAGWLARDPDGRRYALAARTLRLESAPSSSAHQGVRHAVLMKLVSEVDESCNPTALSGADMVYRDQVESSFPLRVELRAARRVPQHCSASGKLFFAWIAPRQREAFLRGLGLERNTATTLTDLARLEAELGMVARDGYAVGAEEFVEGLICVAVPIFAPDKRRVRCAWLGKRPQHA